MDLRYDHETLYKNYVKQKCNGYYFALELMNKKGCVYAWDLQLGGKGANLAEMATIGLSVPPGFTISTEACQEYQQNGKKLPDSLWEEILEGLHNVEKEIGAFLGNPSKPLLLSVRSGAAVWNF